MVKNLNIAVISKSNAQSGGAGHMAEQLAIRLNGVPNVQCHHWLGYPGTRYLPHMRMLFGGSRFQMFHWMCRKFSFKVGLPDFLTPELYMFWKKDGLQYDLYHFHDITRTFSPIALRWLARRKPVVWSMRDCSPYTGGCLFPLDCTNFHTRCANCPRLNEYALQVSIDRTGFMQDYKRKTAEQGLFVPLVASEWAAGEAMKSGMFDTRPRIIRNFVDCDLFQPHDKQMVRRLLGLPENDFIVFLSSPNLGEERKGAKFAVEALRQVDRPFKVLSTGRTPRGTERLFDGIDVIHAGYVNDSRLMVQHYAAADIFLFPALGETFCNAIAESMASGTPPVTFRAAAIPELVQHGVTGWMTEPRNTAGLVEGVRFCMDNPDKRKEWAREGRRAMESYTPERFVQQHIDLYTEILDGRYPGLHHLKRQ